MKLIGHEERPAKLLVNRRAIAAGIATLLGASVPSAKALGQLSNVSLTFDPADFAGFMSDGLFLPDYRLPMVRLVFSDGATTRWHRYPVIERGPSHHDPAHRNTRAVAIETCAPDKNGMPRYAQLDIG